MKQGSLLRSPTTQPFSTNDLLRISSMVTTPIIELTDPNVVQSLRQMTPADVRIQPTAEGRLTTHPNADRPGWYALTLLLAITERLLPGTT